MTLDDVFSIVILSLMILAVQLVDNVFQGKTMI